MLAESQKIGESVQDSQNLQKLPVTEGDWS